MPSADAAAPKRPNIVHRHSSTAVNVARSPHADLSSSAQKHQRPARFVVGNNRLGARNPSFGKNLNKLSKLTPARPADASPTSPTRPTHVKRNSSNINLDASASSSTANNNTTAPLRKNHSETSLKKNRSSGHLVKLARPSSSRNVSAKVATKNRHRRSRTSLGGIQAPEGPGNPTVRFDLGHEEEDDADTHGSDADEDGSWTYTDSRSPSTTRSSTRRNSLSSQAHADESQKAASNTVDSNDRPPSASLHHPGPAILAKSRSATTMTASPSSRPPAIMDRLLKRNVSFTVAPQITNNSATPIMIDPHEPVSQSHNTLNDSSNPEVVSRFLTQSTSTSGPSHESSFLPRRTESSSGPPDSEAPSASHSPDHNDNRGQEKSTHDREAPRRNKSLPSFSEDYVSRTQQRLNLERESAAAESTPVAPPRTLLHVSRLSSANIPFTAASAPGRGVAIHVHQLCDRSAVEYKRVRMYQNPLVSAIARLREAGQLSRPTSTTTTKPAAKSGARTPNTAAASDAASNAQQQQQQLSQSWRSARSVKTATAEPVPTANAGAPRRPRVMFQGINASPEDEERGRGSLDGADEQRRLPTERDALRELCGRLWARNDTGLAGD